MRLTAIPQLARNANRVREIVTILSKYGLAQWLSRLGLRFAWGMLRSREGARLAELSQETRIRLALTELGTTFIKLGQMLSTRADLVGPELAEELSGLQSDAPADPPQVVHTIIEQELGRPVQELFREFEDKPIASASIGQVHRARTADGERVVVKVQHPNLVSRIRSDLDILSVLADLAEEHVPELRNYRPRATTAEFERTLLRELDFRREQSNLQQFARNFAKDPTIHFPRTYPQLTTSRVLTMEYLDGIRLAETDRLRAEGYDLNELARRGATLFLDMIFVHGFYHADPHPGNVLVLRGGVIGLLDCGMVGRISDQLREHLEEALLAVARDDAAHVTVIIMRVGQPPPELDYDALATDVDELLSDYTTRSLEEIDLGQALREITETIRRHHIVLPSSIAMLIKVLVMLDGTARLLSPQFNLTELLAPYYQKLLWSRLSPARHWQRLLRIYSEWEYLGALFPRGLIGLVQQLQTGRFDIHLEHKRLEPSVNRLVFGILTSSLFLGSALLWAFQVPPLFHGISVLGAAGCFMSFALGLRALWAIRRSGHLDR